MRTTTPLVTRSLTVYEVRVFLMSITTQRRVRLGARTLIGRSSKCDLVLQGRRASAEHATLTWFGDTWELRDLGSRNGTWVDGERLDAGSARPLLTGAQIGFGDSDAQWVLTSDSPPVPAAERVDTQEMAVGTTDLLAIPHEDTPTACVVRRAAGWVLESDGNERPVEDGHLAEVAGATWRLHLPVVLARTEAEREAPVSLDTATLEFAVSRDEEFVSLTVVDGDRRVELRPRAHHYLLLTLARLRLEDIRAGQLPPTSHGWIHQIDLARLIDATEAKIDVDIFRARKQLLKAEVEDAAAIVERRARTRQLRLGTSRFRIINL